MKLTAKSYRIIKTAGGDATVLESPYVGSDKAFWNEFIVRYLAHTNGDKPDALRANIAMLVAFAEPKEIRRWLMANHNYPYHSLALDLVNEIQKTFDEGFPESNPHAAAARREMGGVYPRG